MEVMSRNKLLAQEDLLSALARGQSANVRDSNTLYIQNIYILIILFSFSRLLCNVKVNGLKIILIAPEDLDLILTKV